MYFLSLIGYKKVLGLTWYGCFVSIIRGHWAIWPTITPLALAPHMVTSVIHQGGTPGLMLCEVGHIPYTSMVSHPIETKWENAG